MRSFRSILLLLIVALISSRTVQGTTITGSLNDNTGYVVANTDLLQTNFSSVAITGNFNKENISGSGEQTLRDGVFGPLGGQQGATAGEGDSLIYTLNTAGAPHGYNISNIDTYAGWSYGRYGQAYDVSFHLVGTPAGQFTTPISVSYGPNGSSGATGPFPGDPTGNFSTAISITNPGNLATGVDQVQFVFHASPNYVGDYNGYRELDVFGQATPEPASLILAGVGALGLFVAARRRRSA